MLAIQPCDGRGGPPGGHVGRALSTVSAIQEYRANGGEVTQAFGGALKTTDLVILHHVGKTSGRAYETPVSYLAHEGSYLAVGSHEGAPSDPHWVANLEAMPELTLEFGDRTERVRPAVLRQGMTVISAALHNTLYVVVA